MIALVENGAAAVVEPAPIEKLKKTVSASRLNCWLQCRLKFYFRYVLKTTKPKTAALHYGSVVHLVSLRGVVHLEGEHGAGPHRDPLEIQESADFLGVPVMQDERDHPHSFPRGSDQAEALDRRELLERILQQPLLTFCDVRQSQPVDTPD